MASPRCGGCPTTRTRRWRSWSCCSPTAPIPRLGAARGARQPIGRARAACSTWATRWAALRRTPCMLDVTGRLDAAAGLTKAAPEPAADRDEHPADLARFESLAQDLLFAFESGNAGSMELLPRQFRGDI